MDLSLAQYVNANDRMATLDVQNTAQGSDLARPAVVSRTVGTTELSNYDLGADATSIVLSPGFRQLNNPVYS